MPAQHKMEIPDLQGYHEKLSLIKYELERKVFVSLYRLFHLWFLLEYDFQLFVCKKEWRNSQK